MQAIRFDPAKDAINRSKHGVSLQLAAELDWDEALVWQDTRFDYGEMRFMALAPHTHKLYYVAFTEHADAYRIISLRPATRKEVAHYVENIC